MRTLHRFARFLRSSVVPTVIVSCRASALADPSPLPTAPRPHAYAVVVGSNTGGAGQQPLHFAEDDALRMAQVLREVGHFQPGDVTVLLHPSPSGAGLALGVAVYDVAGASFPIEPARELPCGNDVPLPGALRLTGDTDETVCLVWAQGTPVDRTTLSAMPAERDGHALCKSLTAAPKPGR